MGGGGWGILEIGAEVFDEAAFFFGGALVVEGDEVFEELVVGEVLGPAVGVEDGGVEVVVELFEDGDEAARPCLDAANIHIYGMSMPDVGFCLTFNVFEPTI